MASAVLACTMPATAPGVHSCGKTINECASFRTRAATVARVAAFSKSPRLCGTAHARPSESSGPDADSDSLLSEEEKRIASLEKMTRQKRKAPRPPQQRRTTQVVQQRKGRWREGEIFPEGWESMGGLEKAWQLWAGERGFLFWSAKLAFGAIFVLVGFWVLFRFVGPALGLYQLTNSLTDAPVEF